MNFRWIETIKNIEANVVNINGDILISAGCVAYLTPFTDDYRRYLFNKWLLQVTAQQIPFTPNSNVVTILGIHLLQKMYFLLYLFLKGSPLKSDLGKLKGCPEIISPQKMQYWLLVLVDGRCTLILLDKPTNGLKQW